MLEFKDFLVQIKLKRDMMMDMEQLFPKIKVETQNVQVTRK